MLKDPMAPVGSQETAVFHEHVHDHDHDHDLDAAASNLTFNDAVLMLKNGHPLELTAQALLAALTREERLGLLDGDSPFWPGLRTILFDRYNRNPFVMGAVPRLQIPGIRFTDGPRGIVMHASTCFPVPMSRGASWDVSLEQRIGDAIGREGRAQGANFFGGICINLPRHPAWGRVQETYGEDPILLSEFGLALHRGVVKSLMTCVKHYALNSMENARFQVDVDVDDAALHEVYLPHFRRLIEGGVSSVMSSYNSVRGEFAGENKELLHQILREQWGFKGFVVSDFIFGLRDAVKSVQNGLDIEAPFRQQREMHLPEALECGDLEWLNVDRSCARILGAQLEHAARTGNDVLDLALVFCDEHRDLAREAAARGMVLLKNEPTIDGSALLPLDPTNIQTLAIVGRLANKANTGDCGSSAVFPPSVVTMYEGLRAALPSARVMLEDTDDASKARSIAASADVVVCIVGYDAADEGEYVVPSFGQNKELLALLPLATEAEDLEVCCAIQGNQDTGFGVGEAGAGALTPGAGGDRRSLRLRARDVEIIEAACATNSKVVVSITAAGAILMKEWLHNVPAVLMAWYSGGEGGHALADVLLGKVDASGRLPFAVPEQEQHMPYFDIDARNITYDRWFGQRLLDRLGVVALYPLGYGMSYTTFSLGEVVVNAAHRDRESERFFIQTTVTNTGLRSGRHVVQVYGTVDDQDFPSRLLLGFQALALNAGESTQVQVTCSTRPLQRWIGGKFQLVTGTIGLEVGAHAGDPACVRICLPNIVASHNEE